MKRTFSNPDFIKRWEGYSETAYKDTGGVWTIGYGHTKGVKPGMKINRAQALAYLAEDLAWVEDSIAKRVKVPLTQNQYDALCSFVYNIGDPQFSTSTCLRRLNSLDYVGAVEALTWWNKDNGRVIQGLVNRRADEKKLFLTPDFDVPVVDLKQEQIDALFEEFKKRVMEILNG
jgi:lysozyme